MQQSDRSIDKQKIRSHLAQVRANLSTYTKYVDKPLLVLMLLIIVFGLVMVYSTTMFDEYGTTARSYSMSHLSKQVVAIIAGGIGALVVLSVPIQWFGNRTILWGVHAALIGALFLTLVIGTLSNGARSWIALGGFNFQPSEFTKISIVLLFSHLIYHTFREYRAAKAMSQDKQFWLSVALIAAAVFLIMMQPDLGMVIILGGTMFIMLMVNRFAWKGNVILYSVIVGLFMVVQAIAHVLGKWFSTVDSYQLKRLGSFVNPFNYVEDAGYQLTRAYIAFSRGGWFGVGLGQGLTNRAQLPERHTDFILAIVVEETGLIGAMVLLSLLFALVVRLLVLAYRSPNVYHRCILSGAGILYFVQILVNVGGAIGLLPLTGVTLPFVSYGGSSMLMCILLMSVAQRIIVADNIEVERKKAYGI